MQTKPTLYLLVGYPGAGKTTLSKLIQEGTRAVHLWADYERQRMFGTPTHSARESQQLYDYLNQQTAQLLSEGRSVIFDTNFNFRIDRDHLRRIATEHGAETVLIWLTTPVEVACQRAVLSAGEPHTRVLGTMSQEEFDAIVAKLEPPAEDENPLKFDGTKLDINAVRQHFRST